MSHPATIFLLKITLIFGIIILQVKSNNGNMLYLENNQSGQRIKRWRQVFYRAVFFCYTTV